MQQQKQKQKHILREQDRRALYRINKAAKTQSDIRAIKLGSEIEWKALAVMELVAGSR